MAEADGTIAVNPTTGQRLEWQGGEQGGWTMPGIPFNEMKLPPALPQGSWTAEQSMDALKGAGTGLVKGGAYVAGLPGDAQDLMYNMLEEHGGPPARDIKPLMGQMPTSSDIVKKIENKVTGPLPVPQTPAGKVAQSVGEFALPGMVGPGGIARKLGQYVVAPGVASELMGQLTEGSKYETPARMAGALVAPGISRRAITPFPATAGRTAAVNVLKGAGVQPSAGQQTGSTGLRYAESMLGDVPFAPERAKAIREQPMEDFTRGVIKHGVNEPMAPGELATPDVLNRINDRMGNEFKHLTSSNVMPLDQTIQNDLLNHVSNYEGLVNPYMRSPVPNKVMDEVATWAGKQGGHLTGEQYQSTRSQLAAAARGATDPYLSKTLHEMTESLDNAMERSVAAQNPNDAGAFREVRRQWRNFIPIAQAAAGGGEQAAAGVLSPARMRQALVAQQGAKDYALGKGDMSELVRAGNEVLTPLPNSGTAQRMHVQDIVAALAGIPGYLLGGTEGSIASMIGGYHGSKVGSAIGGPLVAKGLFSDAMQGNAGRRGYLTNQVVPRLPPGQEELAQRLMMARALMEGVKPKNNAQGGAP